MARLTVLSEAREGPPYICAVNAEEVWRGVREDEREAVVRLLAGMRIAPLGLDEGRLAGSWRADFARQGLTLTQADCLIAAAALGVGATLATGNPKDFPMDEPRIEHWPVGE